MRSALVAVVLLVSVAARGAPARWVFPDEDDPKLARGETPAPAPWWRPTHPTPRFQLSYRHLAMAALEGGTQPVDAGALDFFPVSNLVRFGVGTELGWSGGAYGLWYLAMGASLGVQWPARVTPFLDGRFVAGILGGAYMGQQAVSWIYQGGLEGGVDVYYVERFYVFAAIGWVRTVYGGVDVALLNASQIVVRQDFSSDAFTVKVGLGL